MRIGLLGGSFDPVHRAHIALAQAALDQLGLDQVQLLPARQPWQKPTLSASAQHRLAMLELAIGERRALVINASELSRPPPTYTIDTLEALPRTDEYFWLLGSDQLNNLPSWHRWREVLAAVTLVAVNRPGAIKPIPSELQSALDLGQARLIQLDFEPIDASSTALRQALALGDETGDWLDPAVADYIKTNRLYQSQAPDSSTETSGLE